MFSLSLQLTINELISFRKMKELIIFVSDESSRCSICK